MRFSRLKLIGFKSFVDPTDLVINDGLTGVVGPNGCGKSNLLEALRWVMGESRPTAMRGGGMEDVIFAGAATRPARNFAEVSLVIDNTERLAPKEFNDNDQLDIVRRITRDAGSAYKAQGKDVRARDVQMLFADASTGAHSPALVRQGQISELINARPKARRRVLEEAAGISGLYQRRHEAELKLKSTETNLARVEDVVENLAGQLQSLARQARQAGRYRELGEKLRRAEGLLLYRRWREADQALAEAEEVLRESVTSASEAERAALEAAKAREAAEAAMPPLREEEAVAGAALQRLTVERDGLKAREEQAAAAVEALRARIQQLSDDAEREAGLGRDAAANIASLEAESAELTKASEGHGARLAEAKAESAEASQVLQDRETTFAQGQEDVARLAARHQSATRLFEDCGRRLERAEAGESNCRSELESAQEAERISAEALEAARGGVETATVAAKEADRAFMEAEEARTAAQAREADARSNRSAADGEAAAINAEVSALERLVAVEESDAEMVLDRLRVDEGFETALGAALADDLRAAEVAADGPSGWVRMEEYGETQALPEGASPLTGHVKIPDVLARRMSQVGLVEPGDGSRLQGALKPGQRLVSRRGDLWRWDGYRAAAENAPSASALRLQQLNRLQALRRDLESAVAKAGEARRAHEESQAELERLTVADRAAREARKTADQALTDANRTLSLAEGERSTAAGRVANLSDALARASEEGAAARVALTEAEAGLRDLGDLDAARSDMEALKSTVEAARMTMMTRRAELEDVQRQGETREQRIATVAEDLATWRKRAAEAESRVAEMSERRERSVEELSESEEAPGRIAQERAGLSDQFDAAGERRSKAADALAEGESALRSAQEAERLAERGASEARERKAAANARRDAASEAVEGATARIAEELDTTPQALLETLDADPEKMPSLAEIDTEVAKLRRQRDALGAVNLRAEEDAKSVQEEHDSLVGEKEDLESAVVKLRSGIASLNKEGRERLLTAFEEVNRSFGTLFTHLFGGGEAKLVLVESDDPLEAGLEIMCQPPGKKLSVLSLLSGGEQTLTALALIFAVFLANPAPICVLDEVDAPLDDANVGRFCGLLDEMTRRTNTRFLIITHHVITMSRMDRLFGVTMAEQGVSQLVSVDLKQAEKMAA